MTHIAFIHSFRGGTGKSNIAANLAVLIANQGKRVGIVDTNLQAPSLHHLFGVTDAQPTFNDYLRGRCTIQAAAYDVTSKLAGRSKGKTTRPDAGALILMPASDLINQIAYVWKFGADLEVLTRGYDEFCKLFALDLLIIDTDPGLDKQTFFSLEKADSFYMIMTPDVHDYQGAGATLQIIRELDIPNIVVMVNKLAPTADVAKIKEEIEMRIDVPVAALLPHAEEMLSLGSEGIFVEKHADHPITTQLNQVASQLLARL